MKNYTSFEIFFEFTPSLYVDLFLALGFSFLCFQENLGFVCCVASFCFCTVDEKNRFFLTPPIA